MPNGHSQRKVLSTQLDRFDVILDGLADALNESVASAVRDVVGQVVKDAVETTIREVLGNEDLLRASLAMHTPPVQPAPSPVRSSIIGCALALLVQKSAALAGKVKQTIGSAWSRSLEKIGDLAALARYGRQWIASSFWAAGNVILSGVSWSWRFRKTSAIALTIGMLSGIMCFYSGPVISSVACGLSSATTTLTGMVLLPLWRLISGSETAEA
jgi:hypothetical protein